MDARGVRQKTTDRREIELPRPRARPFTPPMIDMLVRLYDLPESASL